MRLIVTRPAAQAVPWVEALRAAGLDAVALPLIEIAPLADPGPVQQGWAAITQQALVMFVSANAVDAFFAARPAGAVWPQGLAAASTGPGTSAVLRQQGVVQIEEPIAESTQFDSEALWARLQHRDWSGQRVLIVRGEDGRDWLTRRLQTQGAEVQHLTAYRRLLPQLGAREQQLLDDALAAPPNHRWLFSSSEAIGNLQRLKPGADWSASHAWCSHPRIVQTAREAGWGQVLQVAGLDDTIRLAGQGRRG
jgi:uroporphyrinogen-III synthase